MGCLCSRPKATSDPEETVSLLQSDTSSLRPESTTSSRDEESSSTTGSTRHPHGFTRDEQPRPAVESPNSFSTACPHPLSLLDLPDELIEYICYFLDLDVWGRSLSLRRISLVCRRCRGPAQARWRPFRRIRFCLLSSGNLEPKSQTLWEAVRNTPSLSPVQRIEIKESNLHAPFSPTLIVSIADRCGYTLQELVLSRLSGVNLQLLDQLPGLKYLALRSCKFSQGPATLPTLRRLEINAQAVLALPEVRFPVFEDLVFFDHRQVKSGLRPENLGWLLESTASTLRRLYLHPIECDAFEDLVLLWLPSCRNIELIKLFINDGSLYEDKTEIINALPPHIDRVEVQKLAPSDDDTDGLSFKETDFDFLLVMANRSAPMTAFFGESFSDSTTTWYFRFASDLAIDSESIDRFSGPCMRQHL
ncbi:BQ2448_5110 [Microbotryum intermedium]|uniref:BQ2448_5110 protein n=1 Tax=Microbotryum intermedium TaxID=269621 RepID=A0A238F470_9BASI|nr:BQ2448_5110 [Microbotryum intermedium]